MICLHAIILFETRAQHMSNEFVLTMRFSQRGLAAGGYPPLAEVAFTPQRSGGVLAGGGIGRIDARRA